MAMAIKGNSLVTIKPLSKLLAFTLSCTLLLLLAACGEDGSDPDRLSPQAHKVTLTIGLNGSPSATIGSADLDVILPEGFVLETDNSGQPTANALTFLVAGAMSVVSYDSANGEIKTKIIKNDGFAGDAELMQISCLYPANATLPTGNTFGVTVVAIDINDPLNPIVIEGISEKISISIQAAP